MTSLAEIKKAVLSLPEQQRAALAEDILESLPAQLHDEDEGVAEALLREAEIKTDPTAAISLEELDARIRQRRSK